MERLCKHCNTEFVPKRKDAYYCSHSCRQMAYLSRKTNPKGSIDGLVLTPQLNEVSIDGSLKVIELTDDETLNEEKTTSIEEETQSPTYTKPIDNLKVNGSDEYQDFTSPFIEELTDLTNTRDYVSILCSTLYKHEVSMWVSVRYRSLLEALLTISEMKSIEVEDLKEVCNAFTELINSIYFPHLPSKYPYTDEIIELREKIKSICMNEEESISIKFELKRETRQNLIASRWELSHYVPKIKFSELTFN